MDDFFFMILQYILFVNLYYPTIVFDWCLFVLSSMDIIVTSIRYRPNPFILISHFPTEED